MRINNYKNSLNLNESIRICLNKSILLSEASNNSSEPTISPEVIKDLAAPPGTASPYPTYMRPATPPTNGEPVSWEEFINETGQGAVSVFAQVYRDFLQRWMTQGNQIPDPNTDPEGFRNFQQEFIRYLQNSDEMQQLQRLIQDAASGSDSTPGVIWNSIIEWAMSEETQDGFWRLQMIPVLAGSPVIAIMGAIDGAMFVLWLFHAYNQSGLDSPSRLWSNIDSWISEVPLLGHQWWRDMFRRDRIGLWGRSPFANDNVHRHP